MDDKLNHQFDNGKSNQTDPYLNSGCTIPRLMKTICECKQPENKYCKIKKNKKKKSLNSCYMMSNLYMPMIATGASSLYLMNYSLPFFSPFLFLYSEFLNISSYIRNP